MTTMRVALALLALLALAQTARAYPGLWAMEKKGCLAHPATKESGHKAPTPDRDIKFVIKGADGALVKEVCPGTSYAVSVLFPEKRLSLTTTNSGKFTSTTPGVLEATEKTCPGRVWIYGTGNLTASVNIKWDVPCNVPATVQLRTTSAAGSTKGFNAANATVKVNALCPAKACPDSKAVADAKASAAKAAAEVASGPIQSAAAGRAAGAAAATGAGLALLLVLAL